MGIDPAFSNPATGDRLLAPACGTLVAYPDMPPPAGSRITPSLAEAEPRVSKDGRTYTFTIRRDARFSDGAPVTARAFVHALERILTPAMESDFATASRTSSAAARCSPVRRRRSTAPSREAGR